MAQPSLAGVVRQVRTRLTAREHRELNDKELLERFLHEQDESAFTALVKRHERLVCSALTKVLSDPADVEDAFQATFLVLVRKASTVRWQSGLGTWLYSVAHRVAVHARSQARNRSRHEERAASRAETTTPADGSLREGCALVHEELERLPETLRVPVLLCYLEGKSRDEVAEQLGVTVHTVKGRLERGRNLLRERLVKRGVPLTAGLLMALTHSTARASSSALVQAAVLAASEPSARVADLVNGVSATMILSKIKLTLAMVLLVGVCGTLLGAGRSRLPGGTLTAAGLRSASATSADEPAKEGEIAGQVLDGKGQPIAGAVLSVWTKTTKVRKVGESGADGRFRVVSTKDEQAGVLIAQTKGLGPDWLALKGRPPGDVTLRLEEDVPVQGRVLDLEGRPIANVTVKVQEVMRSRTADLTPYLDAYQKITSGNAIPRLTGLPAEALGVPASVTTDKDGRFRVAGAGRERAIELYFEGKGIESQWFTAITRPGLKGEAPRYFRGPTFDLLVGPGKEMTGFVKEKGTGKPIAGAVVTCQRSQAKTDENGRYRLQGLPKREQYLAFARGPQHFQIMVEAKDTPGLDPVTADFELGAGAYVEGTLREKGTGKPVAGVINYHIDSNNPNLKDYNFSQGVSIGSGSAGEDGKFRVLVIPGRGYLTATADNNVYVRGAPEGWDGQLIMASPHPVFPYYSHAMATIDADAKKPASLKCDLEVDRGRTKSGTVVGPDGQPLTDVIAFGLTAVPDPGGRTFPRQPRHGEPPAERLKESKFQVVGVDPKQTRHLVFLHPEKKLGKVVKVTGEESGEIVVRLEPLGAVTGRALAKDGKPEANKVVQPYPERSFAYYKDYPIELLNNQNERGRMGRLIRWLPEPVKTDAKGEFRLEGLIPGLRYQLWVTEGTDRQRPPTHVEGKVTVEAGKTRELGDLKRPGGF